MDHARVMFEEENREGRFVLIEGGKSEKKYTIAYIEALPEGERAELIDGELFVMETPLRTHQELLGELYLQIGTYIKEKKGPCKAYFAPFAVRIKKDDFNYVEPDIVVVCDEKKLNRKGCNGAPDWVIEVVSPSNKKMDYVRKLALYREAGVREYWIVDPEREIVTVYDFAQNGAEAAVYPFTERIKAGIYEDLWIELA